MIRKAVAFCFLVCMAGCAGRTSDTSKPSPQEELTGEDKAKQLFQEMRAVLQQAKTLRIIADSTAEYALPQIGALDQSTTTVIQFSGNDRSRISIENSIKHESGTVDESRFNLISNGNRMATSATGLDLVVPKKEFPWKIEYTPTGWRHSFLTALSSHDVLSFLAWDGSLNWSDKKPGRVSLVTVCPPSRFSLGAKKDIDGKACQAIRFRVWDSAPVYKGSYNHIWESTIWVDVRTKLPVRRFSTTHFYGDRENIWTRTETFKEIRINEPIEDKTFELPEEEK